MLKKSICALSATIVLSMAMLSSAYAFYCPTCRSTEYVTGCSGVQCDTDQVVCFARGQNVGGFYHSTSCVIMRWYNFSSEKCPTCGYWISGLDYPQHMESAKHTSGGPYYDTCFY